MSQPIDGNGYLDLCGSSEPGLQNGCAGFGAGVVSTLMFWNSISPEQGGPSVKFCVPSAVKTAQAIDVVRAYIERHPETRHYMAGMLGQLALMEAFPC